MGNGDSKQEIINEQISVTANGSNAVANVTEKIWNAGEIFGIAVVAIIVCFGAVKIINHYFKKAVRHYTIQQV
jgi:hypothetical protein